MIFYIKISYSEGGGGNNLNICPLYLVIILERKDVKGSTSVLVTKKGTTSVEKDIALRLITIKKET